jgi:uncharacterized membrane protein
MRETDQTAIPPTHIEGTVQAIAKLHAEHQERATPFQRFTEDLTDRAGRPNFVVLLMVAVVGWIALNLAMVGLGRRPLDEPPFAGLELAVSLAALFMAVLILSTQRRDDELASRRDQLTLELAILSDQKAAKIIELLEELRRDDPTIRNRVDHDAAAMSAAANLHVVLDAIKDSHADTSEPGVRA